MSIQEHLNKIRNAIYGREVRESIAKGIETAYDDASEKDNANMEVKIARGTHPNLRSRLDETTTQLAQTESQVNSMKITKAEKEEVNATNSRIDNLVIPISPENVNVEVTDAHVSITKNKEFESLTKRFESIERNNEEIEGALTTEEFFVTDWTLGGLSSYGVDVTNNTRVTSQFIKVTKGMEVIVAVPGTKGAYLALYDINKVFIRNHTYSDFRQLQDDGYIRIMTGHSDDKVIQDINYFNNKILVKLNKFGGNDILHTIAEGEYNVNLFSNGNISANGNNASSDKRVRTDFIKMEPGTSIELDNNGEFLGLYVVEYDTDKNYISYHNFSDFFIANKDGYIRIVTGFSDDRVINDFSPLKNKITVKLPNLAEGVAEGVENYYSDPYINQWMQGSADGSGRYIFRSNRIITKNFIRVNKGTLISLANPVEGLSGLYLVQYDEKKEYVRQINYSQKHVIEQDGYVRIITKYTDDREISEFDFIKNKVIVEQSARLNNYLFGNFSEYYQSESEESVTTTDTFNLEASTSEDVYAEYDNLLASYPDIMTKKLLGYGGDIDNEEDISLPIYEYTINTLSGAGILNAPKILLLTGIHGDEKSTVWSTVQFLKQMFANWSTKDNLESILSNVNLKIIPVLNPGGYNANTRVNLHGVDCNRNFSYKWETFDTESYNKGATPYSELETQIARDWMIENNDALAFIDFHNVFSRFTISYLDTPNADLHKVYSSQIRRMSNHWYRKYGNIEEATLGQVQGHITVDEAPMTFQEGIFQGIDHSAIIEVARDYNGVQFTSEVIERGVEVIANYILGLLDAYSKNLIK